MLNVILVNPKDYPKCNRDKKKKHDKNFCTVTKKETI